MIYLNAFLFCGTICLISQLILDNTKLTPGHVTSLFVIIGAFLEFMINLYSIVEQEPLFLSRLLAIYLFTGQWILLPN